MSKTVNLTVLVIVSVLLLAGPTVNAEIVDIGVETDKPTYLLEEPVTVFVTAYNPTPEAVTLGFGSATGHLFDGRRFRLD